MIFKEMILRFFSWISMLRGTIGGFFAWLLIAALICIIVFYWTNWTKKKVKEKGEVK